MKESADTTTSQPEPGVGYETSDVNPYYLALFGLGLIAMIALVLMLLGWMFRRLETAAERADPPPSPVADAQTPPAPRLQVQPQADLVQLRTADQQLLSSYGWSDRQQQAVRIPVDRAIAILAERGFPEPEDLPTTESQPPSPTAPQPKSQPQSQQPQSQQPQESQTSAEPKEAGR